MTDRLKNAGFSDEKAGEIISRLERSENPYRELYLYSFYMYTFKYGGDGLFITKANSIELGENAVQDFFNKEEFYTKFFHESGHAIDYNTGNNEYYTVQLESDSIWDAMSKDLKNAVEERVINWLQENPEAVLCTRDELTQKICDKLYSSDTEITREDCPEFSGNEYKAYQYVEKKLKERMPLWETLRIGANVDMRDTFQGCTANKVSKGIGDLSAGHSAVHEQALNQTERILNGFFTQAYSDIKQVFYQKNPEGQNLHYRLFVQKMIGGQIRKLNFREESEGTKRILFMINDLLGACQGGTIALDEIDTGVHDLLLKTMLASIDGWIDGQLIITTHNTYLLETLRPQSIYVINVDYLGNKEVHCLEEYDIHGTNNVRTMYIKGMFGGVPVVDEIEYGEIVGELRESDVPQEETE